MNIEDIKCLIKSVQDEKDLGKQLLAAFKSNPKLIEEGDQFQRTVFHLLVLHNKSETLKILLENELYRNHALTSDKFDNSLLHYVAQKDVSYKKTMNVVLENLPELFNTQDMEGNTPLHKAILFKQIWAVISLVNCKNINHSTKNSMDKTPMDLAGDNTELKMALLHADDNAKLKKSMLHIDLSSIRYLDLRVRDSSPRAKARFIERFPLLSSRSSTERSSYYSSITELLPASSMRISPKKKEKEKEKEKKHRSDSYNETLYEETQNNFKVDDFLATCYGSDGPFQRLISKYCLSDKFAFTESISACMFGEAKETFSQLLKKLSNPVNTAYSRRQNSNYHLLKKFLEFTLVNNNFMVDAKPRGAPVIVQEENQKSELLNSLWLLTACQESFEGKRQCNFIVIAQTALGILASNSFIDALKGLRYLYPQFDNDQKLIANFIVLQMLIYKEINEVYLNEPFKMHVKFIMKCNVHSDNGLGSIGKNINRLLAKAIESYNTFYNDEVLKKFYLLNRQVSQSTFTQMNTSFDAIVNRALSLPKGERDNEVELVARDLQTLTVHFYQNVSLTEFHNSGWLKNNAVTSPNIDKNTRNFDKISNYFVTKLLAQPTDNIVNGLQFLLEIFHKLCRFNDEKFLDLNSLVLISSIFDNKIISRLNKYEKLSSIEQGILLEMEELVSYNRNYLTMMTAYNLFNTTLPFVGGLLKNATFAYEGNKQPLACAEVVGKVLNTLMSVKLLVNFERTQFFTNLPSFLGEYIEQDEEALYTLSFRHKTREKDDVVTLEYDGKQDQDLDLLLDNLNNTFLKNNFLPDVFFNKNRHDSSHLIPRLFFIFNKKLQSIKKGDDSSGFQKSLEKLKETIHLIIKINNDFYYPQILSECLHFSDYEDKFATLEKSAYEKTERGKGRQKDKHDSREKRKSTPSFFNTLKGSNTLTLKKAGSAPELPSKDKAPDSPSILKKNI